MKIALIQINTIVGDIDGNQAKVLKWMKKAETLGADLAIFHEMTLLGYPPRDLLDLPFVIQKCQQALTQIAKQTSRMAVLLGTVEVNPSNKGKPLYNAAAWCENGEIRTIIRKRLLPTYDVFDESRYFERGSEYQTINYQGRKIGS